MRYTDPVCKMEIEEKEIAAQSEYQGKTYHFCSVGCKKVFDKDPTKYVGKPAEHDSHHHGHH